jgi:hypothetical protein
MFLLQSISLACAALSCGAVHEDRVGDPIAVPASLHAQKDRERTAPQPSGTEPSSEAVATPVRLVEFDGAFEFMKTSRRMRIWRPAVEFDMKVDATGHATECVVVDEFRKNYINEKLCELVMEHHTFEPARNAHNEPVPGTYHATISFADLREELE